MTTKFKTRAEYDSVSMEPLKSGVIELMTRLGDIEDQIVMCARAADGHAGCGPWLESGHAD